MVKKSTYGWKKEERQEIPKMNNNIVIFNAQKDLREDFNHAYDLSDKSMSASPRSLPPVRSARFVHVNKRKQQKNVLSTGNFYLIRICLNFPSNFTKKGDNQMLNARFSNWERIISVYVK